MPSYEINMSLKDFVVLLFYKKICPNCNNKMRRVKKKKFIKEGKFGIGDTYSYGEIYKVMIYYRCERCNKNFRLSDIANL